MMARRLAWQVHDWCRTRLWLHAPTLRRMLPARPRGAAPSRVLHVTTSFDLGGTQMQIRHLATATGTRFLHDAIELFPELNYLFRQSVSVEPSRYVRGGPVARAIGRSIVDRSRRGSHLVQIAKLVRDFRLEQPDLVVGWGHEISAITFVAAAIARVPWIAFCIRTVNPHYGWTDPAFAALLRAAHRRMTPAVDRVIVNSTFLQHDHAAWVGIEPARVAVCPNGVEVGVNTPDATARSRTRAQYGISDNAVVVANVGRFSPEKGQQTLIDANRLLTAAGSPSPVVWLLSGDGATLPAVQRAARAQGMDNVVFTGRTSVVADILAASDIFVMPSDFEGMPTAMMEAMAAGLPCVSTTKSGAIDIAREGVEALYYDAGDAAALAAHLTRLIADPAFARRLSTAAAARIGAFDVRTFVNRFEAIVDDAFSGRADS